MRISPYIAAASIIIATAAAPSAQAAKAGHCQNGQGGGGYNQGRPAPCTPAPCKKKRKQPRKCGTPAPPPPQAAGKLVVSYSPDTLPAKYTPRPHSSAAQLPYGTVQIRKWAFNTIAATYLGEPQIRYVWWIPGKGTGMADGHWNGTRIVPSRPIPRIAAMASRGIGKTPDNEIRDRLFTGAPDRRLYQLTTSDSMKGVKVEYRTAAQARQYPMLAPFGPADWADTSQAFAAPAN